MYAANSEQSKQSSPRRSRRLHEPRRQIMLDQSVQGTLMKRVTTYWFLCLAAVILASWIWNTFLNPGLTVQGWAKEHLVPLVVPMVGSLVLLPLAWADMIRLSNRIVAPVHSIRTAIRRLLLGDDVPPLVSRPDDFWPDVTKQFNRLTSHTTLEIPSRNAAVNVVQHSVDEGTDARKIDHISIG